MLVSLESELPFTADVFTLVLWFWNACVCTALQFFQRFSQDQEEYHESDLARLMAVQRREHMEMDQLMSTFK